MEVNKSLTLQKKIETSCVVCSYSDHANCNDDSDMIICTLDQNSPKIKSCNDTCLCFKAKYKSLKVIIEENHLEEYDPENVTINRQYQGLSIPHTKKIGEEEWQN